MPEKARQPSAEAGESALLPSDIELLQTTALFAHMPQKAILGCLSGSRIQAHQRKTALFHQGDAATFFYIVLDGWVKLFRDTADGEQTVIGTFTRGQVFALTAAVRIGSYPASAEAVEHSRLLAIPATSFVHAARDNAALAMNVNATMGDLLQSFVAQIERLRTRSATERVAEFLAGQCSGEKKSVSVHLPHDKALIAARLGMEPETFSRCLAKLRAHGVESKGDIVRIADVDALCRAATHKPD